MIPGYLFTAGLLLLYPWCQAQDFRSRLTDIAILWLVTAVLIGACGILGGILYPVFTFVPVTGKYHVGTFAAHLVDVERTEPYAPSGTPPRELMVQAWYPSKSCRVLAGRDMVTSVHSQLATIQPWAGEDQILRECARSPVWRQTPYTAVHRTGQSLPKHVCDGRTRQPRLFGYRFGSSLFFFLDETSERSNNPPAERECFSGFPVRRNASTSTVEVTADLEVRVADVNFLIAQLEKWERDSPEPISGQHRRFSHGHIRS